MYSTVALTPPPPPPPQVMHLQWHPCAANVLASAGADGVLFIWNIDTGEPICQIEVWPENSLIQSICWNYNGSLIASTCKDKKIRVVDARSGELLSVSTSVFVLRCVCVYLCPLCRRALAMKATSHLVWCFVARTDSSRLASLE